jgi:hypothetical protein
MEQMKKINARGCTRNFGPGLGKRGAKREKKLKN